MSKNHYYAIYLSPHLDDAALSCGGQIFQASAAGQSILIATVTAGDPPQDSVSAYAQSLHDRWELATNAVATRRAEDIAACAILGADVLHWPIPDCIYRLDAGSKQPFYVSDADIFGKVHAAEAGLVEMLATYMRQLPTWDHLFVPLTIGQHVDHRLTRLAAEMAFAGRPISYYEDYPYAQKPGAVEQVIPPGAPGWQATAIPLTENALQTKIAAILAFRSQISTFWTDQADLQRQIYGYAAHVGGERVWQK
jgi:LmbE family N-acetylglucosaminyl deacetylase